MEKSKAGLPKNKVPSSGPVPGVATHRSSGFIYLTFIKQLILVKKRLQFGLYILELVVNYKTGYTIFLKKFIEYSQH